MMQSCIWETVESSSWFARFSEKNNLWTYEFVLIYVNCCHYENSLTLTADYKGKALKYHLSLTYTDLDNDSKMLNVDTYDGKLPFLASPLSLSWRALW